jgi:glycosidase
MRKPTLEGWFINLLPDLNQNDAEVARYLIQNTLWWIGATGVDGIRQDTLPYVARHFWREWTTAIKREYPDFKVVGEVYDEDPSLVSFFQGGVKRHDGIDTCIDALFDFPLYFSIRRGFSEGKSLREAARMMGRDHLYPNPAMLLTFLGLHDVPRFENPAGLRLAFTFLLTARGIPLIYYGDEIGMEGAGDPDNRRDFPGGWPDDPRNAFEPSGRTPSERLIWDHVRKLTTLRRESEALQRGRMIHLAVTDQFLAYARTAGKETVVIAINNSSEPVETELDLSATASLRTRFRVSLGPHSAEVYQLK